MADRHLIRSLKKPANERSSKDVDLIVQFIRQTNDSFISNFSPEESRLIATSQTRYEWRDADEMLFTSEDDCENTCFLLISGLVYVDNRLAYPGTLIRGLTRPKDCIVLEPSEFMALTLSRRFDHDSNHDRRRALSNSAYVASSFTASPAPRFEPPQALPNVLSDPYLEESSVDQVETTSSNKSPISTKRHHPPKQLFKRPVSDDASSISSFSSSNFVPSGGLRKGSSNQQGSSLTVDDIDLTGLTESAVDSDDELLSPNEDNASNDVRLFFISFLFCH